MTPLLFVFLMVLIGPLLVASWRASLFGLALQGVLLAWISLSRPWNVSTAIMFLDFALMRAVFAPWLLARVQWQTNAPRRNDVMPPNLFSWGIAGTLVLLAFRVAHTVVPGDLGTATRLAVAFSGVLFGFLVLATRDSTFSQIVGILRIENAIALFELGPPEEGPMVVQVALLGVFILTVLTLVFFLRQSATSQSEPDPDPLNEEPIL
jgi:hydrogenase-4 component E